MGEAADGRVQLHDSAGQAGVQAHLDDSAKSLDLNVVADARSDEFTSAMD
jgi:hypothetical protein